jgi:hypothetical protein
MIKVLLALITAVAVGIGVRGDSWDKTKNRPTPFGWIAIGLAAVVGCLTIIDIQTTAEIDQQKDARISGLHTLLEGTQEQLKDAREQLKDAREQLKDAREQLKDAREQLKDARGKLKDARGKIVTSALLSAGFNSVEIEIETSQRGGQVNEGWTYTFVFLGSGRPWGFIAGSNYLLMHDSGPALDNISGGMPFKLTETTFVPDPYEYMAPTAYVAHELGTLYRATASDAYIPEHSAYAVQLGHRDVFGVKSIVVKITHPHAREGEVITLNKLSISVNGAPPIGLVEQPNTNLTIGEPETHLGQPLAAIGRPLPDHWLGSGDTPDEARPVTAPLVTRDKARPIAAPPPADRAPPRNRRTRAPVPWRRGR